MQTLFTSMYPSTLPCKKRYDIITTKIEKCVSSIYHSDEQGIHVLYESLQRIFQRHFKDISQIFFNRWRLKGQAIKYLLVSPLRAGSSICQLINNQLPHGNCVQSQHVSAGVPRQAADGWRVDNSVPSERSQALGCRAPRVTRCLLLAPVTPPHSSPSPKYASRRQRYRDR